MDERTSQRQNAASLTTDRLAELIDRKHRILTQLAELVQRQLTLVGQADMTQLLGVLTSKQNLLNELQSVEEQLDPFRQQDPDRRTWSSPSERDRVRKTADACTTRLDQIMTIEKQCEQQMQQRRDDVANRLETARHAAQATQAYASSMRHRSGDQLDVSSET